MLLPEYIGNDKFTKIIYFRLPFPKFVFFTKCQTCADIRACCLYKLVTCLETEHASENKREYGISKNMNEMQTKTYSVYRKYTFYHRVYW